MSVTAEVPARWPSKPRRRSPTDVINQLPAVLPNFGASNEAVAKV